MHAQEMQAFRLSSQQRRIWALGQDASARLAACALLLEGELDRGRLRAALEQVVARHEILRTRFHRRAGMRFPFQVIADEVALAWHESELEAGPDGLEALLAREAAEAAAALDSGVASDAGPAGDIEGSERKPVLRARLAAMPGGRHALLLSLPALCADSRSLRILADEVAALYGGEPLADPVQYADFAEWQSGLLEGEEAEAIEPEPESGKTFWDALTPAAPSRQAALPFELRPASPGPSAYGVESARIEPADLGLLQAAATAREIRLSELLLGTWIACLGRLSGEARLAVAAAFDGRVYEDLAGTLGPLAKFLPVECDCGPELPFQALLDSVHKSVREVEEVQQYFDWERHTAGGELPAFGFELAARSPRRPSGGVAFTLVREWLPADGFQLLLSCAVGESGLEMDVQYETSRFAGADVRRLVEGFAAAITGVARDDRPGLPVAALELLGPAERQEVLLQHQGEPRSRARIVPVHRRFEEQAARRPYETALVAAGVRLTYAELNARANRLARHLRQLGVGPEVPVALCLERSAESIVGMLGVLKAGGAFTFLEPAQPKVRLGFMLAELGAPVILTEEAVAARLPETAATRVRLDADRAGIAAHDAADLGLPTHPEQLAYVVFTSGSTGKPKGVAVEHRQLVNYLEGVEERLDLPEAPEGFGFASVSTLAADLGHTAVFPALCGGGCLHLVSQERATDSGLLAEYNGRHPVDVLKIVPSHLEALLACDRPEALLPRRRLVTGGEALQWKLVDEVRGLAGDGLELFNHYGPSETTVGVLTNRLAASRRDERARTVPLGRPIAGVRTYVVDARLEPVPMWMPGELLIAGASVTRGYLGRPDLTAERFVPDPFGALFGEPGGRAYRTGDVARRLASGEIEFLGRSDNQVKFHGFRIELDEIRLALNQHPDVRDSVIRVARDRNGQPALMAYYVSRQEVDVAQLRLFLTESILEETLPNVYVHLRKLPLTLNGKVAYDALPTLEQVRQTTQRAFVAPRSLTEELLAGMWMSLLGLDRVGLHDNFFELGGHSLLATQLVSRIRQVFKADLPLRVLFEDPTLARLASRIDRLVQRLAEGAGGAEGAEPGEAPPVTPVPRDRDLPLSYAQERMWFLHQIEPESPAYNSSRAFRASGRFDRLALERSLTEVFRRHEALRTTFAAVDGEPRQVIAAPAGVNAAVPLADLSPLPEAARQAEAERLVGAETRRPFDLARGPLLRALLVRLAEREHLLVFTAHHITADAWSRGIFIRELMTCYAVFSGSSGSSGGASGAAPAFAPLPVQYADFSAWQRRWIQGERLEAELAYWKRQLAGAPEQLELPADFPRPPFQTFRGGAVTIDPAPERVRAITELSRREGVTPFMALLAVFDVLLQRYTGQDDLVVGTDIANRNRVELEGLVGLFVNNVVLRTSLAGNPTFRELLQRVREVTLGAYAHQDLPFDRLVTALRPRRDPSRTPLFQVLFVMQNTPLAPLDLPGVALAPVDAESRMCKFDLAVFLSTEHGHLSMTWNYSADLFSEATVRRMAGHFERLLESACERPESPLSDLEMLTAMEKERLAMERTEREEGNALRLRSRRRSGAAESRPESLVRTELADGRSLPLIVQPNVRDLDLVGWASAQGAFLEERLTQHGAILLRGFNVASVGEFERFATALCSDLFGEYGDLPREEEGGKVYHSTPYPADKTILFHNESSHLPRWPTRQFFYCVQPSRTGGETPIVDCRAMYRELPEDLVRTFEQKNVAYVRNFTEGLDVPWQEFFKTDDRDAVAERCREVGMELQWKGNNLQTRQVCRAVRRHPQSGEAIWFNQLQLHHPACLDAETRASMLSVFGEDNLPRNVTFGDGTPIPDSVMAEISAAYWRLAVSLPWQQGDVLMLDNMLVAHARNPFSGPRKIVVAMGSMVQAQDL